MAEILLIGSIQSIGLELSGTREAWPLLHPSRYALIRHDQQKPCTGSRSNAEIVTESWQIWVLLPAGL